MSRRYLDIRNCKALLPSLDGLPVLERLEECLIGINDQPGPFQGLFDKLLKHNKKTANQRYSSMRYFMCPLDIAQVLYFDHGLVNTKATPIPDKSPVRLHLAFESTNNMGWKITIPLQYLMKKWGDANEGYQGYVHTICHNWKMHGTNEEILNRASTSDGDYYYAGITGRNWLQRLNEHVREVRNGGRRQFYRFWRDSIGIEDVHILSALQEVNMSYKDAMNWEEFQVDHFTSTAACLNMIPGGFRGLKELHKMGYTSRDRVSLKERERAVDKMIRQSPLKGVPNLIMSELWKDPEHYAKVIGARSKSLSIEQVHRIRELGALGWKAKDIVDEVGALNRQQVYGVLRKRTYSKPPYV